MKLYQIVVIGCLIVGTMACILYLHRKRQRENLGVSPRISTIR